VIPELLLALFVAALWLIEGRVPLFAGRQRRAGHYALNLSLGLLNAVLTALLAFALVASTAWAESNQFGLLHLLELPSIAESVLAIVLFDLWQYVWHRLNHRIPFLWRFHAVHHADAELDASTGVRFHPGEILLSFAARLLVLPLLGMSVAQLALYQALSLPVILFHHANLQLPVAVDRLLRILIVTPGMHVVHHSRWRPETDSNYSSLLSVWDRLSGSFRLRESPGTIDIGLDDWSSAQSGTLRGVLLAPVER
jgi:sterol desaturase/sphingolipid hydroxylase (fatty acid hydroxylase superfamily)